MTTEEISSEEAAAVVRTSYNSGMPLPVGDLTENQTQLIQAIEQFFLLNSRYPSHKDVAGLIEVTEEYWTHQLYNDNFREGICSRGMSKFLPDKSVAAAANAPIPITKTGLLTATQLDFINRMLDPHEVRRPRDILKEMTIPAKTYQMWLKDAAFREYYHMRARAVIGEYLPEVKIALQKKATSGDINAIRLVLEMTGEWTDKPEKDFNPLWFVTQILDILQRNIPDTEILDKLAVDIMEIVKRAGVKAPPVTISGNTTAAIEA